MLTACYFWLIVTELLSSQQSKECQAVPRGQNNGRDEDNTVVTLAILYKLQEIVRQGAGIPKTK